MWAKDFGWHASQCFPHFTPYVHIHVVHDASISRMLSSTLAIGRLKNEVVQWEHREAKSLHAARKLDKVDHQQTFGGYYLGNTFSFYMCSMIAVASIIYTLNTFLVEFINFDIHLCGAFQLAKWDRMDLHKEFMSQYMHLRMVYKNMLLVSLPCGYVNYV